MRYLSEPLEEVVSVERKMAFVAGPRQVGKTTLAKSLLPASGLYFNWDVEAHRRVILRNAERFWEQTRPGSGRVRIVLDEIHKFPRWKRFLKGLYDGDVNALEILVTGSGRLDVYQKGGDSLLGRYALHRLHPFTVGELLAEGRQRVLSPQELDARLSHLEPVQGASEALDRIEQFTGFPEPLFVARHDRLRRWRRTRRRLVLQEDLRDLTRVREIGLIDQMVSLLPDRIGSPLSINSLREDLGVAFNTAQGWLQTLERLYFLFEIRPYAARISRALRREGKVYLFDPSDIENPGARFENVVALHLAKLVDVWNDLGHGDFSLHYVRDKQKYEVDFLIADRRRPYLLVETKLTDGEVAPALRRFGAQLRPRHIVQLVRRGEPRVREEVLVAPAERLLPWM